MAASAGADRATVPGLIEAAGDAEPALPPGGLRAYSLMRRGCNSTPESVWLSCRRPAVTVACPACAERAEGDERGLSLSP
eukprot:scaffold236402_cov33-Tisochrysis_lutea.AAC.5